MSQRTVLSFLLLVWAATYAGSFWHLLFTDPTDDGFTRGLNRVMGFMAWQVVAMLVGTVIWIVSLRPLRPPMVRWLLRLPALLGLGLVLLIAGTMVYSRLAKPPPAEPPLPKPATVAPDTGQ